MSESQDANAAPAEPEAAISQAVAPVAIPYSKFLESAPPSRTVEVEDIGRVLHSGTSRWLALARPEIEIHCDHARCGGQRVFRSEGDNEAVPRDKWKWVFVTYTCSNCKEKTKTFSLAVRADGPTPKSGLAYKFGEMPVFGPRIPPRLIKLIGKDRDNLLKGRQCESQNLGVGAFSYYRRVVENQKNQILSEVIRVALKLSAPAETVAALEAAKVETQFKKAMESVKDALPQTLMINGLNPLTLLHMALSEGLHAKDDAECLDIAQDIRVVLAELSERLAQALKDEAELNNAVNRLTNRQAAKKSVAGEK
jgi:hypothetical protein